MERKIGLWIGVVGLVIFSAVDMMWSEEEKQEFAKPETKTEEKTNDKSDPKAKELLLQAIKKTIESKGYYFEGKIVMEVSCPDEGTDVSDITINGAYQSPDLHHIKMRYALRGGEEMAREIEAYIKGNKAVVKQDDAWEQRSANSENDILWNKEMKPAEYFINTWKNYLEKENFLGDETLKNKNCRIVTASLSSAGLDRLKKDMQGEDPIPPFGGMIATIINPLWKTWISEKESLVYKYTFFYITKIHTVLEEEEQDINEEKWEMTTKTNIEISFFDYDKNIEIKLPPEVKELLEKEE